MKFAYLVMYELRALHSTAEKINKYIIEHFNADVILVCQKTFDDDEERIKLLKNVKYAKLYDKPDAIKYFGFENIKEEKKFYRCSFTKSNMQIYINFYEMKKVVEEIYKNYDYFIIVRVDIDILFNFPPLTLFKSLSPQNFKFHQYSCGSWKESGMGNIIHRDSILDYLSSYYDYITQIIKKTNNILDSQEELFYKSLLYKNIKVTPIENLGFYFTATTLNDYTTWSKPVIHPKYKVICKYEGNCDEAFKNLELWNKGLRWSYTNNKICLI